MKKTYVAPMMEREIFETSDVITISFNVIGNTIGGDNQEKNLTTVNVTELDYE